jgi:valyl-tRNA synthetase
MIHPFMPFLTEELWQRLPRRSGDKTPSIVIAKYPQYDSSFDDPVSEAAYELLIQCSQGIRSLKAEYSIAEDPKIIIQAFDATSQKTIESEIQSIKALSGKGGASISVLGKDEATPSGCAVFAVSSAAAVYLQVKGRVDVQTEVKKLQGKLQKSSDSVRKQRMVLDAPDFADKVSDAVLDAEKQKLVDLLSEQGNYEKTLEQFEKLKLEESS